MCPIRSHSIRLGVSFVLATGLAWAGSDVTRVTTASGDGGVTVEWLNPAGPPQAVLVLRHAGSPVTNNPTNGNSYNVGDDLGGGDVVACISATGASSCAVTGLTNGTTQYLKLFGFGEDLVYSSGVGTKGFPRDSSVAKWGAHGNSVVLSAVGAASSQLVGIGNDGLLHRMAEADGRRGEWQPPLVGGAVQARPMAGDINPTGPPNEIAYLSSQNGHLYRYSLGDGANLDQDRAAAADAGCEDGVLQAGAVAMLHAFDTNGNPDDDVVLQATRCDDVNDDGTLNDNKVLMYSHDLGTLFTAYDGGTDGLGISNATPRILYRSGGNNLLFVPLNAGGGESLAVLEIQSGHSFGLFAQLSGIGDINVTPEIFIKGFDPLMVIGNTTGNLYLYLALVREGGGGSSLVLRSTIPGTDGPVKGIAVSTAISLGGNAFDHWVVWTTDTQVHGVKIPPIGMFDPDTRWDVSLSSASAPFVLRNVVTPGDVLAYVGGANGTLYELNATTGATTRTWGLDPGTTVGDPTFDYNDGQHIGIVAGTTGGTFFWVPLN